MLRSIKLLCSPFINRETEDCNRMFLLEMEYGEKVGSVLNWRLTFLHQDSHFITKFSAARNIKRTFVLYVEYD